VLSTPPAFVLSQDQTLQTKNIQKNLTKKPETKLAQQTASQSGGTKTRQKTNNKQKPPNTLLSSQTTHPRKAREQGNPASVLHLVYRVNGRFRAPGFRPGGSGALPV
jgi:hypothetical protein